VGLLGQGQGMSSQYITVRETAQILAVSEKKVMDLIEGGNLQAYKIADQFLRLKRNEVVNMLSTGQVVSENVAQSYTSGERVRDFFYFNDFYLVSLIVIGVLLYIIFFTY
jgi:excisionase family DNA binding protein